MAIQGKYYFSAQNGIVTSNTATSNPYASSVTVDSTTFIQNDILQKVITDTHFDSPDRKGRLVAFLSRIYTDYNISGYAIACDEYTAVCIEPTGQARVFGGYPSYDDNAYFVQVNCELTNPNPEVCSEGNALTWNHNGQAVKAFQIKGDATGSKLFDLNSWETTSSGTWYNWSVANGTFQETVGIAPSCSVGMSSNLNKDDVLIYPNPATHEFILTIPSELIGENYEIIDNYGKIVISGAMVDVNQLISIQNLRDGMYILKCDENLKKLSILNH